MKSYFIIAIAILALGIAVMGYLKGRYDGRVELLNATVRNYEKRAKVDGTVENLGRFDLCISLGGVPDECSRLRGVEKTAKGQ